MQANAVSDGGIAVSVVKIGTGLFILNAPASPQFQTLGSNIDVQAEPASATMLLGGIATLLGIRRRRR